MSCRCERCYEKRSGKSTKKCCARFNVSAAGYVYAPYVPLQVTPTIFSPDDVVPEKVARVRYSKKLLNKSFYATISVIDTDGGEK